MGAAPKLRPMRRKKDETMKEKAGDQDPRLAVALSRHQVVGRYLSLKPRRGLRKKLLDKLSCETWMGANGEPLSVSAETIRAWVRRYLRHGLNGLKDKERPKRGVLALTQEQQDLVCRLKQEVPERSLERIIEIAQSMSLIEEGILRRSTVHRVLQSRGLSKRCGRTPDNEDLDRFEAPGPNIRWQSDELKGPWLPDPDRPGKVRRANLFAFIDDHSRMLLHGRWSFAEDLPHMELVFRRALQKHGIPDCAYFDNGKVYQATHVKQMAAELGIHRVVFTKPYRPMGHGKIEAFNRYVRSAFIAELKASHIETLEELNEAFLAFIDKSYNNSIHSEIGETPRSRWERGIESIRLADEEKLRQAFLWTESRTPDKAGVFSLLGIKYQVGAGHGKRRFQVRFDPEALHEVEVWRDNTFIERVKPFQVSAHRRAKTEEAEPAQDNGTKAPVVDYLGHLMRERRKQGVIEPKIEAIAKRAFEKREENTRRIIALLDDRLKSGVVNADEVRSFMERFGPFDADLAELALDEMIESGVDRDLPVSVYLGKMLSAAKGGLV
jgi:transposase InsO family protein